MKGMVFFCLLTALNTFIIITAIDIILMGLPSLRLSGKCRVPEFLISSRNLSKGNRIDFQSGMECSAYSCAFLLRHFGRETTGEELYREITGRRKDGTVYPGGVRRLLSGHGLTCTYCTGSLEALKNEVSKGAPVIVLIRTYPNRKWLHYVPVVGFDRECIFIAESLAELANCQGTGYNRKIPVKGFRKLWYTSMLKMPLYRNTFFVVSTPE